MGTAYQAARQRSGWIDRSSRGRIVVSGSDRASYLQGLLTNDIAALTPGSGCYSAYLTAQGRMISDLWVYELGEVRSEEHTSELQSRFGISYAVFCLKKKKT